ncbi:MAG TPA: aromatic ring-hydroxylating dioxygenase subunit alpha [Polyangiaceae bacterium LLY-WYZ-15_(1-7)]|nr:(2Fe-2S)-binding protein [Myxococcales bacterium]MAT25755.1 (2Fe-2S)-binding protein [Sandaracinus sp.]HJK90684.1 aromatic ring-hydroxylating dioxygenase subunit alpha [Polyangiaceae bacterium LLY-WYZ-15_(1-7)]MBJ70763.1 (2Fe-2S)-binding protein [Sandaracinus sp.]HJL04338.1 aromatic ring-hydroxylating dioxygenase subunit alpha [Polyangiaceae bacterium LLY-WYZ-15_(1-7)]
MARLTPLRTKPASSAARVLDDWYVAARSDELRRAPLARTLLGLPIALYRGEDGVAGALLDRCPHRNVPLSAGRVEGRHLECGYHGWQFDRGGACRAIPGLCDGAAAGAKGRHVHAYPTREQDGFVWVYLPADQQPVAEGALPEPLREPFRFPHVDDPRYVTVRQTIDMRGTLHAAAENALDVPHTAFLHRGLFRGTGDRNEIDVEVRRWHDRVEAEYFGEPRPEGLIGRVLAPRGGTVEHVDRFLLPCIAQVEYRLGESHVVASTALTPIRDHETRLFGAVSFRLPFVPPRLGDAVARALVPLGMTILKQDARMLAKQTATIETFGGEQFVSTELDVLGPHILRLLRQAERGRAVPVEAPVVETTRMQV